jgi:hypothetical protein
MAQSTVSKVDELEKLYRLTDADKVTAFLSERPGLLDILLEARPQIELQFGKDAVVELRFPREGEGDPDGQLMARIKQSDADAASTPDGWDKLWDSWWGDVTARPESWDLHIGIDYTGEPG